MLFGGIFAHFGPFFIILSVYKSVCPDGYSLSVCPEVLEVVLSPFDRFCLIFHNFSILKLVILTICSNLFVFNPIFSLEMKKWNDGVCLCV